MAVTKEEISMTGFAIVAYSGDAKTALMKALENARVGKIAEARKLVEEANQSIVEAHNEQTKLLANEAGGMDMDVTFIMVHGQDTLMTTMMLMDQCEFFIDEYERINKIEEKLDMKN
ncbi:PTS lactose/cellobiose transporter subunit IIA [Companilactobacillus huachuanensis]|uniref:PTS system lactose-specific EIIA component n=1 Tax=Companilactobacillus huachuanensis TaxID=2559914 RepID=A0ABW1RMH7_9LACO|nr:PTS lactose/cellobiose transporter subunit IIA [Companilactobacillus huachuanensis]